ncbi:MULTISPECIES: GNAT family N-acetyltransferase [unclassified Streptomyces]|uniref:GNAT family N-acetyltransferase n=1 Tax=Streptomyces sp. NPDC127129 TaxID=3345373 RepID=UPI003625D13D
MALSIRAYRPEDDGDRRAVTGMFAEYLCEGALSGSVPLGRAVACDLATILACHGATIVGFAGVHTHDWQVELLFVAPAFRRQGVARVLLSEVDQWARRHDRGRDGIRARPPVSATAAPLLAELGIQEAPHSDELLDVVLHWRETELADVAADCDCEDQLSGLCPACCGRWAQDQAEGQVQTHLEEIRARPKPSRVSFP